MRLLFFAIITVTGNVYGSIILNTRRKPLVCRPQSENGIAPTAPVECGCRATWNELGDISEGEKTDKPAVRKSVRKTGKHRRRHSVCH